MIAGAYLHERMGKALDCGVPPAALVAARSSVKFQAQQTYNPRRVLSAWPPT